MSMVRNGGGGLATMGDSTEIVTAESEAFDLRAAPSALEAVTRAEIDRQISTAKAFPRSMSRFLNEAKSMVGADPDLAAQCTYYLPARSGNRNDPPITGPSVRLAEIVALCWGNLRIVGRISDDDGRFITAQSVAMDLERNVGYCVEVRRGVTKRNGQRFGDEMVKVSSNAAIAIAQRNATFKIVPRAFVNLVEEEAQRVARGDVKTLPDRAARALAWFAGKGVPESKIYAALEIKGQADFTLDLLMRLNGMKTAIADGHASIEELFPDPAPAVTAADPASTAGTKAERLAQKLKGQQADLLDGGATEKP